MTEADRERAQELVRTGKFGALSTLGKGGHPFGSLVAYATTAPILLISDLAEHTQNLRADPRAALLVVATGPEPLAQGRVTLMGRCTPAVRAEVEADYLAAHPSASAYLALGDFGFWRLAVESVRYVGGFGKMGWIDGAVWSG
jgi:hypothetical protein